MVRTHDCAMFTLLSYMLNEIFVRDILFSAFKDAFKSGTIVNFFHNWVQLLFSLELSVADGTFSRFVIRYTVAAYDFVAACAISWLVRPVIAVSTDHPVKQAIWACIERLKLGLQLLVL